MAKGAAARAAARKQRDKWKSKRWFTIRAPRHPWSFRVIGETIAEDEEQLIPALRVGHVRAVLAVSPSGLLLDDESSAHDTAAAARTCEIGEFLIGNH